MDINMNRKLVSDSGIDVDYLLNLLVTNAAAELTTYYYYTILRNNLTGIDGEAVKSVAEAARIEDRNHYEALVPRIYELGGKLPSNMADFIKDSACPPIILKGTVSIAEIIDYMLKAEECAAYNYNELAKLTNGKDFRTYDLVTAILNEELEHCAWFRELLTKKPSGHFFRTGEYSPFVSKFLR